MITISEKIKEIVKDSPLLEEGLLMGIINLSALARQIKPQIESALIKDISESAVLMALKRFSKNLNRGKIKKEDFLKNINDIIVRSNLNEYTFLNSESIFKNQKLLLHAVEGVKDKFLTFTQGIFESTIIASSKISNEIEKRFSGEKLILRLFNLSAITMKLSPEILHTPGVYYSILKQLAWNNINVIEVVSTSNEFTIILEKDNIDNAFSVLMNSLTK